MIDAETTCSDKSPKRGRLEDLFEEMVSIPQLVANRNFSLEVVMIRAEETRQYQAKRRRRTGEWAVGARRLVDVVDQRLFTEPADWRTFLPTGLSAFTTKELATATNTCIHLARKIAYCLRHGGLIELSGRDGKANRYRVVHQ